ncbi:TAXI family TRAP transporter solute-binding subunit [Variovorax sp. PCZ-1]|uniref:TAXI family TRAP transporter solute-binding subunit n=1 Tax=Variovorax sp. PCZ-1 TaxID=2835533 RepID=UPI001BCF63FB|nr:TAXI family TRAP transporter solute-binding subunit [Variovorax sp. PCZ-1]MBS7807557.1 ABC transporter substrate-binding protein [Variovorax sp. PCZ-1]
MAFFALSDTYLPIPPSSLNITTGRVGGMYHEHAKRYAEIFASKGITLNILESAGSGQNLERLRSVSREADMGFLQGGFALGEQLSAEAQGIQTIARVDVEPIWVFSRFKDVDSLLRLQGQRVTMGQLGSGSRAVATRMFEQVRLEPKDLIVSETVGMEIVSAMREGRVDAAIFVASVDAPLVKALLDSPGIHLAQLKRSAGLSERLPYLNPRFVAAGSLNPTRLQPPQDGILLSTLAGVLVREELHPMIKRLLAQAVQQTHSGAGPLHRAGEFPHLKQLEFPSAPQAREVMRNGYPWLEQHLSLHTAQWAYRLLFIGLPLALLAFTLSQLIPRYLHWRIESSINGWYGELKFIENDLGTTTPGGLEIARYRKQLAHISEQLFHYQAPQAYMQRLYMLHQHIKLVQSQLVQRHGR